MSRVESLVEEYLRSLRDSGVRYYKQYQVRGVHEKMDKLRWDFLVRWCGGERESFIEVDGIQHYRPMKRYARSIWTPEENFKRQWINDRFKDTYCRIYNRFLLRIRVDGGYLYNTAVEQAMLGLNYIHDVYETDVDRVVLGEDFIR